MGLFSKIRASLDRGGIGLSLSLPRKFKWSDGTIPAEVTLKGHKSEARRVSSLAFIVADDERDNNASPSEQRPSGERVHVTWDYDEPIELAPGETRTLDVSIELPEPQQLAETVEEATGHKASGFMKAAFTALSRGASPENIDLYLVTVSAHVDEANKPKRSSKHIQQGSAHKFGVGGITLKG